MEIGKMRIGELGISEMGIGKMGGHPYNVTQAQVQLAISNSSLHNSTGLDGINIHPLKHLGPIAILHLTHLLKTALNRNVIPQICKLVKIIPIPKPNKGPCSGTSFRPIHYFLPKQSS